MAERVSLTREQAEALLKLRAKHGNDNLWSDDREWVSVDDDTRPHKVLTLPDTARTL
jgi:hypothetical protein